MPQRARLKPRYEAQFSIKQLRAFVALSETLNFTAAAKRLHITQPSLSALVHQLERHACAPLFIRDSQKVKLSHHGEVFKAEAKRLQVHLDQTLALARHLALAQGEMRLRVGAPVVILPKALARLAAGFESERPGMMLEFRCVDSDEAMALLQRGEIDMAFVTECKAPEGVSLERLQSFKLSALIPQSHPLADKPAIRWDDLRRERLLLANRPERAREAIKHELHRYGVRVELYHDADDVMALLSLVELGFGLGLVSPWMRDLIENRPLVVRSFIDPVIELHLALALPRVAVAPLALAFKAYVQALSWNQALTS
jgi:DNA-binding transcriptional LysR family regulator